MKTIIAMMTVSNENTGDYIEIRTNNGEHVDDPYILKQIMTSLANNEESDVILVSKNHEIR